MSTSPSSTFIKAVDILGYQLVFWVIIPATLFGLGWSVERALPLYWEPGVRAHLLATLSILTGSVLLIGALTQLRIKGRGFPVPMLAPKVLVTGGLYAVIRHPLYVGYTLLWFAISIQLASVWMTVMSTSLLLLVWYTYVVYIEEPDLLRRFGTPYEEYRQQTPLLLPRTWQMWLFQVAETWQAKVTGWVRTSKEDEHDTITPTLRRRYLGLVVIIYVLWIVGYFLMAWVSSHFDATRLQSPLDRWLPFVPIMNYPYILCYLVPLVPFFTLKSQKHLNRLIVTYVMMNLAAYCVFIAFPVETIRPHFEVNSFTTWLISVVYSADTSRNCFPSLHAATAWFIFLHVNRASKIWGGILFVAAIGISAGAVLIKQHYIADILFGAMLALWFVYAFDRTKPTSQGRG
ncbi:MAG TPA: hypothetical protein DCE42_01740 [Myxococcales bacterium]|nr:hypothetical protein [Deltaproteobacteria bacterium]HAA53446.1 hypothetical protein [Myxococcales bacterium]|tara:strand:+ start:1569 stop:2777 length:1209 start_codon:yes stop_codon:yes gene_type:complete